MGIISLVIQKLKAFRMTVPSLVLLVLASYRTLTSGDAIVLVGVCATVVPFMCQFKNFPRSAQQVSQLKEVLSNYILNLILMVIYLAYVLILTWVGKSWVPGYVENPHFLELLLMAVCADVVYISAVIPVCHDLKPMQRLLPGLILCNGMLVFMMMAKDYVSNGAPASLMKMAAGVILLILVLTVNFIVIAYGERRKK